MLFWQPQGPVKVPLELDSESNMLGVLLSSVVRKRVNERLSWKLSEKAYSQSLNLLSNRHDWNPRREIFFRVTARAGSPEQAEVLCKVASEELSQRCQELGQEFEEQFLDMEILKIQSALSGQAYQAQTVSPEQMRRLRLSIAAAQLRLLDLKDKLPQPSLEESTKVKKLRASLGELQSGLDELWLQRASGEVVEDMEREFRTRHRQLQKAIDSNHAALIEEAEAWLQELREQERDWSAQSSQVALDRAAILQGRLSSLVRAKELVAAQNSMYCLVYRPAGPGQLQASTLQELWPSLLALLLLVFSLYGYKNQEA